MAAFAGTEMLPAATTLFVPAVVHCSRAFADTDVKLAIKIRATYAKKRLKENDFTIFGVPNKLPPLNFARTEFIRKILEIDIFPSISI